MKQTNRIKKVFDFVVKHKTDCYRAFKLSADHKGFKTPEGTKLIELAREEIGYSTETWSGDIYYAIWRTYKAITIDGVSEPEEIKDEEYKLIPMSKITDEARKLAVAWMECEDKNWILQKHKLASDIMNYAIKYHSQFSNKIADINFIKWYSGMEESKIRTAYARYLRENGLIPKK